MSSSEAKTAASESSSPSPSSAKILLARCSGGYSLVIAGTVERVDYQQRVERCYRSIAIDVLKRRSQAVAAAAARTCRIQLIYNQQCIERRDYSIVIDVSAVARIVIGKKTGTLWNSNTICQCTWIGNSLW